MAITSYEELSTFARILYAAYKAGNTDAAKVELAGTQGKITLAEKTFILG